MRARSPSMTQNRLDFFKFKDDASDQEVCMLRFVVYEL